MSSITKENLFKRQTTLSEIGEVGQQKLQDARVLIVGCGGLGSPIAIYLATSGVGRIHLVDFDKVALSNLHRQVFYTLEDIGKHKSKVLYEAIQKRAPFTKATFSTEPFTKLNASQVKEYDIIIDGTDSLPTKYLLNDVCVLNDKPLVYGSLYKFDGYVATFNCKQLDGSFSANLRDVFPEMSTQIPNCEEAGTLNPIVGMVAMAQVNEVIKLITDIGKPLINQLLLIDALQNTQLNMKIAPKVLKEKITAIFSKISYFDAVCEGQNPAWQISVDELKEALQDKKRSNSIELVAVLPNLKLPFKVHKTIPIQKFDPETFDINPTKTYVMVCQKGLNSYKATKQLKDKYPDAKVFNLTGGIAAY